MGVAEVPAVPREYRGLIPFPRVGRATNTWDLPPHLLGKKPRAFSGFSAVIDGFFAVIDGLFAVIDELLALIDGLSDVIDGLLTWIDY